MGIISNYFVNKNEMSERDYSISKIAFIGDEAFAVGVAQFITAPHLAGLLKELGASEAMSNFILSLNLPAGLIQLLIPLFIGKVVFKKPFIYYCRFFDKLPLILTFFVPLIFGRGMASVVAIGILLLLSYIHGQIMIPFRNDLFMQCASDGNGIGKFCGIKDSVANITAGLSAFLAGTITTWFVKDGDIVGYSRLASIALVFWFLGMISLFFVKEPYNPSREKERSENLKKVFTRMLKDQKFRPYVKFILIYNFGANLVASLTNVMSVQRMGISLSFMTYSAMACLVIMTVCAPIFGKISDKAGHKKILALSIVLIALTHLCHAFMTPENAIVLKVIGVVLSGVGSAALGAPLFSFLYQSLPETGRASYMSCISALTLAVSYVASIITTFVLGMFEGFYITLFGIRFYEMNLIFVVGAIIVMMSTVAFISEKK